MTTETGSVRRPNKLLNGGGSMPHIQTTWPRNMSCVSVLQYRNEELVSNTSESMSDGRTLGFVLPRPPAGTQDVWPSLPYAPA